MLIPHVNFSDNSSVTLLIESQHCHVSLPDLRNKIVVLWKFHWYKPKLLEKQRKKHYFKNCYHQNVLNFVLDFLRIRWDYNKIFSQFVLKRYSVSVNCCLIWNCKADISHYSFVTHPVSISLKSWYVRVFNLLYSTFTHVIFFTLTYDILL